MNKRELCACFNIWSNLKLNRTVKVWRLWWRVRWREMGWRCYEGEARVRNNQNVSRCKLYHETRLSSPLSGEIESELMSESAQCERHMRTRGITRNAQLSIMVSILTSHTYIEDHSTFHGTFTDAFQRWNFQGKYKYIFSILKIEMSSSIFFVLRQYYYFVNIGNTNIADENNNFFEQIFTEVKEVLLIL